MNDHSKVQTSETFPAKRHTHYREKGKRIEVVQNGGTRLYLFFEFQRDRERTNKVLRVQKQ